MAAFARLTLVLATSLVSQAQGYADNSTCPGGGHVSRYVTIMLVPVPQLISPSSLIVSFVVTNPQTSPVGVTVDHGSLGQTFTLAPGEMVMKKNMVTDGTMGLVGSSKTVQNTEDKVLVVTACSVHEEDVLVHGTLKSDDPLKTTARFSVPPVSALGLHYVVLTHCRLNHCQVGIVATQPDVTHVNISLRLRHSYDVNITPILVYGKQKFHDGDVITETLNQFQPMQILCLLCDMSGSRVTASLPVAVLAGGELTPIGVSTASQDTLLEFLPPTDALGTRYVIPADADDKMAVKVVAVDEGTAFTLSSAPGKRYWGSGAGDAWLVDIPDGSGPLTLVADHRVLVALLIHRNAETSDDGRMTVLAPMSQWRSDQHEVVIFSGTIVNQLVVVADDSNLHCLRLDGTPLLDKASDLRVNQLVVVADDSNLNCLRLDGTPLLDKASDSGSSPPGRKSSPVAGCPGKSVVRVPLDKGYYHLPLLCDTQACGGTPCRALWGYVHGRTAPFAKGWAFPLSVFRGKSSLPSNETIDLCHAPPANDASTSDPLETPSPRESVCLCHCKTGRNTTLTFSFDKIDLALLSQTARQRNRKLSAPDDRLSATVIGSGGVFILMAFALVIVCIDVSNLLAERFHHRLAPKPSCET